jgi:hypothetical protein
VHGERRENSAVPTTPDLSSVDAEGTQDRDTHVSTVDAPPVAVKARSGH